MLQGPCAFAKKSTSDIYCVFLCWKAFLLFQHRPNPTNKLCIDFHIYFLIYTGIFLRIPYVQFNERKYLVKNVKVAFESECLYSADALSDVHSVLTADGA